MSTRRITRYRVAEIDVSASAGVRSEVYTLRLASGHGDEVVVESFPNLPGLMGCLKRDLAQHPRSPKGGKRRVIIGQSVTNRSGDSEAEYVALSAAANFGASLAQIRSSETGRLRKVNLER